jgi:hypothetical protein
MPRASCLLTQLESSLLDRGSHLPHSKLPLNVPTTLSACHTHCTVPLADATTPSGKPTGTQNNLGARSVC